MIKRRDFLAASAAALTTPLAAPPAARAETAQTLRYVNYADIPSFDPHWVQAGVTRIHSLAVYDTLYGMGTDLTVRPQMVEGAVVEEDGRRWTLTLRPGLKFHDGEPVRAQDCAASVRRWGQRNEFGQALLAATDEVGAADDKTVVFRLKRPFPLLPDALGTPSGPMPFILPERFANTPNNGTAQLKHTDSIGSGPYRYKPDERVPGYRAVYERFADYQPRPSGEPDWLAGPKVVHFDRVEYTVIPDHGTMANALRAGEADWLSDPQFDLLPMLRADPALRVVSFGILGDLVFLRLNHRQPPFNNPAICRALLGAISQTDCMVVIAGTDPTLSRVGVGFYPPGTPMASTAGLDVLAGPRDFERARRDIRAAGYADERVVMMMVSQGILGDLVFLRLNHRQPPFNNPAICRALLGAVSQADCMAVVAGTDPTLSRVGVGFYPPGTPMASTAGLDVLTGPRDFERARRDLGAAGYAGERVVMMNYSPDPIPDACGPVIADVMTRIGLNVERQTVDVGTWYQRVSKDTPVDQGGWSCYCTDWLGTNSLNPAMHIFLRGNGSAQRPATPASPRLEGLRDAWLQAPDLATRQALAAEIQVQALSDVSAVPLGQEYPHTAYRASLEGVFPEMPHVFWNVRRRG
jgi:peptide/nickel transport system substrate-binding protein